MRQPSLRALGAVGALACTCAADAWEFRTRWVQRVGNADIPLTNNVLVAAPGATVRVRMQFGVFDDANGPAPAGGYIGWNVGTLFDSEPTSGVNTRTPGRLSPFTFAPFAYSNGSPTADPWTSLIYIDNTLGWQVFFWNGIPGTASPAARPPATVRGFNEYVSTYEFTTVLGNVPSFTITAGGNRIAATNWQSSPITTAPDPGDDGIFGPGDFNNDGIDDGADDIAGTSAWTPAPSQPMSFQSVLAVYPAEVVPGPGATVVMLAAAGLVGGRRRRRSISHSGLGLLD